MEIHIEDNPNCPEVSLTLFQELEKPRRLAAIRVGSEGSESLCDVAAVHAGGSFGQAHAVKIADSGEGTAYLIYGGSWGIRLRPCERRKEPWDLKNAAQWGEPYKIYGSASDLIYSGEESPAST